MPLGAFLKRSWRRPWPGLVGMDPNPHTARMSTSTPAPAAAPSPEQLDITLLGGFSVTLAGAEIAAHRWPSLRSRHLVQLLSLQPLHRLSRERVVDALWPDCLQDAGLANLRKAVHHTRQALGRHDAIALSGGELCLWPGRPLWVDAEVFEQEATQALRESAAAGCALACKRYSGELLPGTQYEAWALPTRERLLALFAELLRASAQWERLARLDPTDEPAHRALMLAELDAGNRPAALRWYAQLREALRQSLGVLPDATTEALYTRCLAGQQARGPDFVGRADERAQVAAWLALPGAERPGGIVLRATAGMGKSALCREVGAMSQARGWQVLRIDAVDTGQTYGTTAAIAERLILAQRDMLDHVGAPARAVLARLSPLAAPGDPLPGALGRHQVVGALRRLLLAWAGGADLLLQVDDAHLIDDADVDVLLQLATAGPPLCLLLCSRPVAPDSALAQGLARLLRAGVLRELPLPAMDAADSRRLARHALGTAAPPDDVVDHIVQASEGHPFAIIELARCAGRQPQAALPASAAEAITERLCDVPPDTLVLLRWLALCGDELDAPTVDAMAQLAGLTSLSALDHALDAEVLQVSHGHYRFRHALVRQSLVEALRPHHLRGMHQKMAILLGGTDAAPARVARHWLAAGQASQAVPWLLGAARQAMQLAAFSDVLRHLGPVLDHQPGHAEALRLRAEALDNLGAPAALAAYRRAAEVATEIDAHNLRAKAALAQVKQGDPKGALLALQGVHPTSVDGLLSEALAYSGAAALGATDPAMGTAKAAVARKLALASGDTASLVIASWAQAAAAHARGELHRSVWADLQETSHLPHLALRVFDGHLCITQRFLYGARPYADVIRFATDLATEAQRLGAGRGHAFGVTLRGEAEWLAGDLPMAVAHLREGMRLHRAIGGPVGEALGLQRLAELALHEGRRDDARALLDDALDMARQTDIGFHLLDRIYGTRILQHANDPQKALHVMEDASASVRGPLETCPGCRITFAVPAAIAAARAGEVALAEAHEHQCAYLADVVMRLPAWHAAHAEVKGHIAAARRAPADEVVAHFAHAAQGFRLAGHPIDAARCERAATGAA
jgi:DNA-binding SARP family transcriptional activator